MNIEQKRVLTSVWFEELRNKICAEFELIEAEFLAKNNQNPNFVTSGKFERKQWNREGGGGGEMSLMKGNIFEKVGVNISTVFGKFKVFSLFLSTIYSIY